MKRWSPLILIVLVGVGECPIVAASNDVAMLSSPHDIHNQMSVEHNCSSSDVLGTQSVELDLAEGTSVTNIASVPSGIIVMEPTKSVHNTKSPVQALARLVKKHGALLLASAALIVLRQEISIPLSNIQWDRFWRRGSSGREMQSFNNPTSERNNLGQKAQQFLSKHVVPSANNERLSWPQIVHYTFERLNDRYGVDAQAYSKVVKNWKRSIRTIFARLFSRQAAYKSTMVVMDWTGLAPIIESSMSAMTDQVSFLIDCHANKRPGNKFRFGTEHNNFEVVILLETPGGAVSDYALAAQQIVRMRDLGINVTVCVDKVAASGGYMMACTSSPGRLFAAPFAVVGSIGAVGQTLNVHNVLKRWGVNPVVVRGGKDKAPIGLFGEVTKEGLEEMQLQVDDAHRGFKRHVVNNRPGMASRLDEIATGKTWMGYDALDLGLVDRIVTSDEYIGERIRGGTRVLKLLTVASTGGLFSRPEVSSSLLSSVKNPMPGRLQSRLPMLHTPHSLSGSYSDDLSTLARTMGVGIRDVSRSTF